MILYGGGAPKDGGPNGGVGGGGGTAVVLKKGPWTAAEDEVLAAYVREHGEGNWNAVQKNTGLARCGKSCRLRWANHLRPNLKKGAFTSEEERLIIQLHAQLGNKWARMAAQLPGRTDNEIKNYWNTRLKRLQRQGLPLYPPDIVPNHQLQSHHHHHHHHTQHLYLQPHSQPTPPTSPLPSPSSAAAAAAAASSSSFTFQTTAAAANILRPLSPAPCHTPTTPQTPSRLSSTPPPPLSPPLSSPRQYSTLPLFALPKSPTTLHHHHHHDNAAFTFPRPPPLLQPLSLRPKRFNNNSNNNNNASHGVIPNAGVLGPPFSPLAAKSSYSSFLTLPYSSPATPTGTAASYLNPNDSGASLLVSSSPSTSPLHSFSLNPSSPYHASSSPNHNHMLHSHFTPSSLQSGTEPVYSMRPELPSNQIPHSGTVRVYDVANFTDNEKHHHHHHQQQNHDASLLRRSSCELLENVLDEAEALAVGNRATKRRQIMSLPDENNNNNNNTNSANNNNNVLGSFGQESLKQREDESLQMNAMQEDIAKLLDWGSDSGEISNGHSSVVTDDNLVLDVHQFASLFPVEASAAAANEDHNNKNATSCSWDNLPGIC